MPDLTNLSDQELTDLLRGTQAQGDIPTQAAALPTTLTAPQTDPTAGIHPAVMQEIQNQQQAAQPPKMGGTPLLFQYIRDMVKGPQQASPLSAPTSRGDMTLNFIGQFLSNLAQGMEQAGHGPGANLRGFAGGVEAPYQRSLQQYQVGQQAQQQQAAIEEQQARAQLAEAQAEQMKNVVQTPYGPMSAALASKIWPSMISAEGKVKSAQVGAESKEKVAGTQAASAEKQTSQKLQSAADIAKQKLAEARYEANLRASTAKDVAQLRVAAMRDMKEMPTSSSRTMGEMATAMLTHIPKIESEIDALAAQGKLGVIAGRFDDFMAGKVGADDPAFTALRTDMSLFSSGTLRTHFGARGGQQMYDRIKSMFNQAGQSANNLKSAIDSTSDWFRTYQQMGRGLLPGEGTTPIGGGASKASGPLTIPEAQEYLRKAGGNKDLARKMAKADGRTF